MVHFHSLFVLPDATRVSSDYIKLVRCFTQRNVSAPRVSACQVHLVHYWTKMLTHCASCMLLNQVQLVHITRWLLCYLSRYDVITSLVSRYFSLFCISVVLTLQCKCKADVTLHCVCVCHVGGVFTVTTAADMWLAGKAMDSSAWGPYPHRLLLPCTGMT